jgi:transcriptional regulator with XRE-family HTH domain
VDFDTLRTRVGQNLRKARWIAGLTQEQVAGVTLRYYQDLERGKRNPTLDMLHGLAEQFGVTVADLVSVVGARPAREHLSTLKVDAPKPGRKRR